MFGPASSLLVGALALSPASRVGPPSTDSVPRLVVLIVVDQFRPDELLRYRAEWAGGFKRILDQGVVYTHGQQDHAITETAPGHSTLLSGRFPAHTGIASNDLGVPDSLAAVLGDPQAVGASPRRFLGTTLVDWLLARDSSTRVLSVSRKDRGAILPIGRSVEQVYWWSNNGFFTTSRYYRDTLPDWVRDWNDRAPVQHLAGRSWTLLLPDAKYAEPDNLPWEQGPDGRATFPHRLPTDPPSAGSQLTHFPWMDSLTLDLALDGVSSLGLGQRGPGRTDVLSVSLSTVDRIGHDYGPDSREMHDLLLRLDGYLGRFMDSLSAAVPARETIYVLAADHGVQPVPEQSPPVAGHHPTRVWYGGTVDLLARTLGPRWRVDFGIRFDGGLVLADVGALRARGIRPDSLSAALARSADSEPYVARVYTPRALASAPAADLTAARWRRSIPNGLSWLLAITARQGDIWDTYSHGANHGTPWQMDVEIPIVFWGDGLAPRTVERPIRSVDIAPTLARLLGIRPTEVLDGASLPEVAQAKR